MIMKNINIEQIKSKASILPYMVWGDFVSCWFFVISPDKKNQKEYNKTQNAVFKIPKMELMGYTLVPSMSIDLLDIVNSNENFKNIYEIYRTFASGMIVLWLVQLAIQKEKEFMGGGR